MPYMMGGFPDDDASAAVASAYCDAGADLVELGFRSRTRSRTAR